MSISIFKVLGIAAGLALVAYLFGAFCAASLNLAEWPVAGRGWTAGLWLLITLVVLRWQYVTGDLW